MKLQMKTSFDLLTGKDNKYLKQYKDQMLQNDALKAFIELRKAALNDVGVDLAIISSFRDFEKQKSIWNMKVSGERKVFDEYEKEVDPKSLSPLELIQKIIRFSAIPGASRHHWGTDIDIYDQSVCESSEVKLIPSEYSESGKFDKLSTWLTQRIESQNSFGFYRPYKTDLGGVHPEAWHLSFAPISVELQRAYTFEIFQKNIQDSDIKLKEILLDNAPEFYHKLVLSVDLP